MVLRARVADVHVLEAVVRLERRVGHFHEIALAVRREPPRVRRRENLG